MAVSELEARAPNSQSSMSFSVFRYLTSSFSSHCLRWFTPLEAFILVCDFTPGPAGGLPNVVGALCLHCLTLSAYLASLCFLLIKILTQFSFALVLSRFSPWTLDVSSLLHSDLLPGPRAPLRRSTRSCLHVGSAWGLPIFVLRDPIQEGWGLRLGHTSRRESWMCMEPAFGINGLKMPSSPRNS